MNLSDRCARVRAYDQGLGDGVSLVGVAQLERIVEVM